MSITPDPDYDFVPEAPPPKKGQQCGKCGMKFDYGVAYSYYCSTINCPMGWGAFTAYQPPTYTPTS